MPDYTGLTPEEMEKWADVIAEQTADDYDFQAPEYGTMPTPDFAFIESHMDEAGGVRLPVEARPNANGVVQDDRSTWTPKLRFGYKRGQEPGCTKHGFDYWSDAPSRPYCKKCRADRYYAKAEARGAVARDNRKYASEIEG